jgi:lipid-binding SYLF domain-containing protein
MGQGPIATVAARAQSGALWSESERNAMKAALLVFGIFALTLLFPGAAAAASNESLDNEVKSALSALYEKEPGAKALGARAKGVLMFPTIRKAGLIVGGQHGEGALLKNGKVADYYSSNAISVGLEAGVQSYSYALFFMTDEALKKFESSDGFEIGGEANVVFVDSGAGAAAGTTSSQAAVYGFVFGQKGLMAGVSLQGTKITKKEKGAEGK